MTEGIRYSLGLAPRHVQIVSDVLHRHVPDRPVWAYGSRATGRHRRWSGLDLAVGGAAPLAPGVQMDLADAFDASLLPIEVDVIDLNEVDAEFRGRIERHFVPVQAPADEVAA